MDDSKRRIPLLCLLDYPLLLVVFDCFLSSLHVTIFCWDGDFCSLSLGMMVAGANEWSGYQTDGVEMKRKEKPKRKMKRQQWRI